MKSNIETERLSLGKLSVANNAFIYELVNTAEWKKFIGERNIHSLTDADAYIQRILDNNNITYWVVSLKDSTAPIGIITFIKRDYLDHADIGFAFLPRYSKKGYAFEAAKAVLHLLINDPAHTTIVATTLKENYTSIQLLQKLGFNFSKEIHVDGEPLSLYAITYDKVCIDTILQQFFSIFTNKHHQPNWQLIDSICLKEAIIIKKTVLAEEVYTIKSFIEPRKKILSDGTLINFEESETSNETTISGNIAQRYSHYKKSGLLNGETYQGTGRKMFQFVKTGNGWKISAVVWEDDE